MHPRRVQPRRPGRRLIDHGYPGGAGSAPPPGALVLLESGSRIACVPPEIEPAFVERTEPWRP